jgi:autoinducer 2 (AI-2) kinase
MVCAPSRLCWYKAHAPEIHARIRYALSFSDWMVHQLCGVACSECSSASDLMMLDVGKRRWSTRMAAALGWDVAQLQPLLPPGEKAGEVHERAAAETGLRVGAPVIVGGGDTQSALLGMGVLDDGQIGIVAGSSAPVALINDQPVYDPDDNLWIGCHVLPDRWLLEANSGEMGSLHQWMIDSFAADLRIHAQQSAQSVYHLYDETAREAPIGCRGVTAHLGPRRHNLRSVNTGRPAGLLLPFGNAINQNPSRENLLRAFYENCAFALRANVELVETAAGRRASSVTLGGGMSRSALLCEILAATLDRPVQAAAVYEASALGAAICAAAGAGLTGSLIEGAAKMIRPGTVYEPDADAVDEYAEFYERWVEREAQLEEM